MGNHYTLPGKVGRGLHYTVVAGSSPVVEPEPSREIPIGFHEDALWGTDLYEGERVNGWTDGQGEENAYAMKIVSIPRSDVETQLTVDELDEFLDGGAVVPGPGHVQEYDLARIDDRIVQQSVEDSGLFPRGRTVYLADPSDVSLSERLMS